MKKPTDAPAPRERRLSRVRAAIRTLDRAGAAANRGHGGYEAARVSAELSIIADRLTPLDR